MNLKEKLQQIAKNKILKSQKSTVTKKSKSRAGKNTNVTKNKNAATYFPQVPIGFFKYTRPTEAAQKNQTLHELAENFKGNFSRNIDGAKTQAKKRQHQKKIESQYQRSLRP